MERSERQKKKQEFAMKNMYFNRFMLIRYVTALFFFSNLYWAIFALGTRSILAVIPVFLLVLSIPVLFEHVNLYGSHANILPATKRYYLLQVMMNVISLLLVPTPIFSQLFGFMKDTREARIFSSSVLILGILIGALILLRLKKIRLNEDRQFVRIKRYEEIMTTRGVM
ncbi:hypothetical protein OZX60_00320 [Streptococcaceae bacterium ESL0687]|nr:hypothetical protein OZX60_00320 [Streptococcaceae bacterium ESL0687]